MIKVINKRGTTRNIDEGQLNEYKLKGYEEVIEEKTKTNIKENNKNK